MAPSHENGYEENRQNKPSILNPARSYSEPLTEPRNWLKPRSTTVEKSGVLGNGLKQGENMEHKIEMVLEKETPNKIRYKAKFNGTAPAAPTIYIEKWALGEKPPQEITMALNWK